MNKLHLLAAAVTVALASTLAVAQTAPPAGHARPDANGDGVIDRSEAAAFPKLASRFDQLDKDKDGRLTAAERPQHGRGMRGGRHGGGAARGGRGELLPLLRRAGRGAGEGEHQLLLGVVQHLARSLVHLVLVSRRDLRASP